MRVWKSLAAAALALTFTGCATPKPAMIAGSTTVLRQLRDWRGTWTGRLTESPMGPMSYTLYVEDVGGSGLLRVRMAHHSEAELETVSQKYDFIEFKQGTPTIKFTVSQRNSTQEGRLTYSEGRSSDSEAVFCLEGRGCDKLMVIFTTLGPQELSMRTVVDEAAHTAATVAYVSPEVPPEEVRPEPAVLKEPAPSLKGKKKLSQEKDTWEDSPYDVDVKLKENIDEDITHEHLDEPIQAPSETPAKGAKKKK